MSTQAVVDIGNQRTKWAFCTSNPEVDSLPTLEVQTPFREVAHLRIWNPAPIHWRVGSVNSIRAAELQRWLKSNRRHDSFSVVANAEIPLDKRVENPEGVGTDRLLACWGALQRWRPSEPAIVVDIGTAVTIDLVTPDRQFLGGNIFAGPAAALAGLNRSTAQLPEVPLDHFPKFVVGDSTERALQAGIWQSLVGGVLYIVQRLQKNYSTQTVIATGGGLNSIGQELPTAWVQDADLVLFGIASLPTRHE